MTFDWHFWNKDTGEYLGRFVFNPEPEKVVFDGKIEWRIRHVGLRRMHQIGIFRRRQTLLLSITGRLKASQLTELKKIFFGQKWGIKTPLVLKIDGATLVDETDIFAWTDFDITRQAGAGFKFKDGEEFMEYSIRLARIGRRAGSAMEWGKELDVL